MANIPPPRIFIKEIEDHYSQENWYKLKLYLDRLCSELDERNAAGGGAGGATVTVNPAPIVLTQISKVMNCDTFVDVGDWVYHSLSTDNFAERATNNNTPAPIIGKVILKPSATQATVVFSGIVEDGAGRGRIFLSTTGTSTPSAPTAGFVQRLGISFGDGTMMVNPELHRVRKI